MWVNDKCWQFTDHITRDFVRGVEGKFGYNLRAFYKKTHLMTISCMYAKVYKELQGKVKTVGKGTYAYYLFKISLK